MKRITIKDDDRQWKRINSEMKKLSGATLLIGVFSDDEKTGEDNFGIVELATVHEFGIRIAVTEKMRNYLAALGYPLKSSTTEIEIPERSFIRRTADEQERKIVKQAKTLLSRVAVGDIPASLAMDKLGNSVVSMVQKTIGDIESPPLTQMTIDLRDGDGGSASPLQDTGRLWQSIEYEVRWS
jgi:hypothetical protein